jgi:hypothetical protein
MHLSIATERAGSLLRGDILFQRATHSLEPSMTIPEGRLTCHMPSQLRQHTNSNAQSKQPFDIPWSADLFATGVETPPRIELFPGGWDDPAMIVQIGKEMNDQTDDNGGL